MLLRFNRATLAASLFTLAVMVYTFNWGRTEARLHQKWKTNPADQLPLDIKITPADLLAYPPLRTSGRDIVDAKNKRFKLAAVNWYGASDQLYIPGGLATRHRSQLAKTIRRMGFNSVRLPYSDEMVMTNPPIAPHLLAANADLVGLHALEIFGEVVRALTAEGLAVVVNNHVTHAEGCCDLDPCDAGWSNDHLGSICRVSQSEEQWIRNWETIMTPFVNNSLVVGADLRNEVGGILGSMTWNKWATAAEKAGNRLLAMNPDWLIIVGGTSSGNDLSGARDRPVELSIPEHVVYSSHVYSWSGWGSFGGRYSRRPYESFATSMDENWGYLLAEDLAPVWVGEFGVPGVPDKGEANYWQNLVQYLKERDADFAYWAVNAARLYDDETQTFALLEADWETPVRDFRLKDLQKLMNIRSGEL